jgi:hypothetical protein
MSLMIRPIEQNDAERCGRVGYQAHKTISSAHGYPSEQPSEEFGIELIRSLLGNLNLWGVLAERQGTVLEVYSYINFRFACGSDRPTYSSSFR